MGIIKKILYFFRLLLALAVFIFTIAVIISYFSENNFFNIPFDEIKNYILSDVKGFVLKSLALLGIITFIFGRIWCSIMCPVGTFQEIIWLISRRENEKRPSYFYKYILLIIVSVCLYFFHKQILSFVTNHITAVLWGAGVSLLLIGILTIFKGRFFCTDICPLGALYGLVAKFSIFRIHQGADCMCCSMCEEVCPSGCIDTSEEHVNNVTCVKCLRCFNACDSNGMNYGIKLWKR